MRALLSIGCNDYAYEGPLDGAESDAARIFHSLIKPEHGEYDVHGSRLLFSPTLAEVRSALAEILFDQGKIDTFTFFFAGHGTVRAASFDMLLRDSRPEARSTSALSLSEVFRLVSDAGPAQTNIIIDACEAGGLIEDLGALLKSGNLGNVGTPGITLVATSAQDQEALETAGGGFGTNAILACIDGSDFVQDISPVLNLVEIGTRISSRISGSAEQIPVVWGLNLSAGAGFCKNPKFGFDPSQPLREVFHAGTREAANLLRNNYERLWPAYSSVGNAAWTPRMLGDVAPLR